LQNASNYSANFTSCWHEAAADLHTAELEMKHCDTQDFTNIRHSCYTFYQLHK